MEDTPDHIHKKQLEIILSKPMDERLRMGLEMMENGRQFMLNRIKAEHPGISEKDLKIEFIKQYYKHDLSEEYLKGVIEWIEQRYR